MPGSYDEYLEIDRPRRLGQEECIFSGKSKITTFLMFSGQAEEAMNFYSSLFDESEIKSVLHHEDGTVLHATFTMKGQTFMCIDSNWNITLLLLLQSHCL
jgi:hypothetical protein